jgi:hypothetical protein
MRIGQAIVIPGAIVAALIGGTVTVVSAAAPAANSAPSQVHSDYNGDGISDLAIAASWETVNGKYAAGAVNVIYGSGSGLSSAGNQFWTQDSPGVPDIAEQGDNFGTSLTTGDFDGDGFADLAVGSAFEGNGSRFSSGSVTVLFGSPAGLSSDGSQVFPGAAFNDQFGYSLTAGDFDLDGYEDLAGGLPNRAVGGVLYAGAVEVLYGSASGLNGDAPKIWTQNSRGVPDEAEDGDALGWAVAAGDFNGDGAADLAGSAYEESVNGVDEAGSVTVLYGGDAGLTSAGSQAWSQDTSGVQDQAEDDDEFGYAMTAGDLNGDGSDDLAVASFGESLGSATFAGSVNLLYGSPTGLSSAGNQFWTQATPGVPGHPGVVDRFGSALAPGDFNGDGVADLALGIPGKAAGAVNAGAAIVLYGSAGGLTAIGAQPWSQDSPGI